MSFTTSNAGHQGKQLVLADLGAVFPVLPAHGPARAGEPTCLPLTTLETRAWGWCETPRSYVAVAAVLLNQ